MSQLHTAAPRRRHASVRALLAAGALAAPVLTACSNEGPVAPRPSVTAAPTRPNNSGFTVSWGRTGNGSGEQQTQTSGAARRPETPADSVSRGAAKAARAE